MQRAHPKFGRGRRAGVRRKNGQRCRLARDLGREVIVGFTGTANPAAPAARQKAESVGSRVDE
jgi:sugar phosphate isomerase/epimerase